MAEKRDRDSILSYCLNGFHEDEKGHNLFCKKAEDGYRAWRGILEKRSEAAAWTNKQHPALAYQAADTILAGITDPDPQWKLSARPRMVASGETPDAAQLTAGVEANELLLADQLVADGYAEKQPVSLLQNIITGITVSKDYWKNTTGPAPSTKITSVPIYAPNSGKIIAFQPKVTHGVRGEETYFDGPTNLPIDVRDFIWHQAATSLDSAIRVTHRVWKDFGELKELERQGVYENVDELIESQDFSDSTLGNREQELFQTDRTKDKIEVLECWIDHGRRVVSIGNRKVVLRDMGNPFHFEHLSNRYPFVVCSTTPDMFRIPGVGEMELIREVQEILWTLLNQRLDNLQLINNAIVLLRDDVDDPDSFDFYPGARNLVSDPSQVQMWTPNIQIADLSMNAEGVARNDLSNLIGTSPAANGELDQQVTATQINLVTTLAQRRLAMKKQMVKQAGCRTADHWIALNQHMITENRFVPTIGKDGVMALREISPMVIQGRYHIQRDQMDESLLRQERRGEAQALMQVVVQAAPVYASAGMPLNLKAPLENLLDTFGIQDKDAWFAAQQQQLPQQPAQAPPGPQGAEGVTGPAASDSFAQSGTAALSQALASQGGSANVGQEMPLNGR